MKRNAVAKPVSARTVLRALRRRAWYILLAVVLIMPPAAYYVSKLPQRFFSRALVGAEATVPGANFGPALDLSAANAQEQLRAVKETVLARPVLEDVIREFHVDDLGPDGDSNAQIEAMRNRIQIQVDGPQAFYLGFKGSTPEQAKDVSNHLAALFVGHTSEMRDQRVDDQDRVLGQEVDGLRRQVEEEEASLRQYQEKASQDLPERVDSTLKQNEDLRDQIQAKTDKITEAEGRRASILAEMHALETQGVLAPEAPEKTPAQIKIEGLRQQLATLRAKYTPSHPEVKRVEKEIADLQAAPQAPVTPARRPPSPERLRYIQLQAELTSIDPELQSYRKDHDRLTKQLEANEVKLQSAPGYSSTISQLTRDVATVRTRYEAALAKQQEMQLNHRQVMSDRTLAYQILEPATLPSEPSSPHRNRILLVALAGSLGLGLLGLFLAERMDSSFESVEQLEAFSEIPVLAGVPKVPTRHRRTTGENAEALKGYWKNRVVMFADPQSVAGQQYGILALKLRQRMDRAGGKILVVTSGTGAEGKSVTAVNLSLALAASTDGRVLLIDGDLRLPQVAERLNLHPEKGLGDWIENPSGKLEDYVVHTGGLEVISGGLKPIDPVAALNSPQMREILAQLRQVYSYVVIDSPPVVPVADSHVLAELGDRLLVVVRAGRTRPELVERALESLGTTKIAGLVLNGLDYAASPYAYAYRYYQQHYLGRT